jgi:hypothetical protein
MRCYGYAQNKHGKTSAFKSYKGLVMAGYQGWFNTPDDGAATAAGITTSRMENLSRAAPILIYGRM